MKKVNWKGLKIGWKLAKQRRNPLNHKICIICGKQFIRRGKKKFTAKYCSVRCRGINQRGKQGTRLGKGNGELKECFWCKKKIYVQYRNLTKRNFCSRKCAFRYNSGERSVFWKGGKTKIRDIIRKSKEYKLWRKSVFERDNYICIWCGKRGGQLHADHIKPFALFPELRFAIDNGRTLCEECHKKTSSYLNNKIKKEDYSEKGNKNSR